MLKYIYLNALCYHIHYCKCSVKLSNLNIINKSKSIHKVHIEVPALFLFIRHWHPSILISSNDSYIILIKC